MSNETNPRERVASPMGPLDAADVIQRLCKLQGEVHRGLALNSASDCFCGKGGFWSATGDYGGTYDEGYRNDGDALAFIERAVSAALAALAPRTQETNDG